MSEKKTAHPEKVVNFYNSEMQNKDGFDFGRLYDETPDGFYEIALEFAKQACGTNPAFFPNKKTMETIWVIHAEQIHCAMHHAYQLGRAEVTVTKEDDNVS